MLQYLTSLRQVVRISDMTGKEIVEQCLKDHGYESPKDLDSLEMVELVLDIEALSGIVVDQGSLRREMTTAALAALVEKSKGGQNA